MNKMVRAVARGVVVSLVLAGLASVPGARAQAATAPQEGEHDVVVNANPVDTTPHVQDGNTQAVVDLGSRVIVGGKFAQVKRYNQAALFARNNIFAYDKATGAIDTTFVPAARRPGHRHAEGGRRQHLRRRAVQERQRRGRRLPREAEPRHRREGDRVQRDTERDGLRPPPPRQRRCSPGGTFTKIRNLVRTNFAMLNATTGQAVGRRRAVHRGGHRHHPGHAPRRQPDGTHLVVIGNFTQVGGQYRPNIAGSTSAAPPRP